MCVCVFVICVCVCVCAYARAPAHGCGCALAHTNTHTYTRARVCLRDHTHAHTRARVCAYATTHTHTHTHTQTHAKTHHARTHKCPSQGFERLAELSKGHAPAAGVAAVCVHPTGQMALSAADDRGIALWNMALGKPAYKVRACVCVTAARELARAPACIV